MDVRRLQYPVVISVKKTITFHRVGIVVFTIVSVLVSFCGYKFLNWYVQACPHAATVAENRAFLRYEKVAWIPVLITFIITVGIGGKHLLNLPPTAPATSASILGFAGTQAGYMITWSGFAADYSIYLRPKRATYVSSHLRNFVTNKRRFLAGNYSGVHTLGYLFLRQVIKFVGAPAYLLMQICDSGTFGMRRSSFLRCCCIGPLVE